MKNTTIIIPAKANSTRLPRKNLVDVGGLPLIQGAIRKAKEVNPSEIFVLSDSDEILSYARKESVGQIEQPKDLATNESGIVNAISYALHRCSGEIIVRLYCTSPFLKPETISKAIKMCSSGECETVIPVYKMNRFFWIDGKSNYNQGHPEPTQNLKPMFQETCSFVACNRSVIESGLAVRSPVGFIEQSAIESIDIDTNEDLEMAIAISRYRNSEPI